MTTSLSSLLCASRIIPEPEGGPPPALQASTPDLWNGLPLHPSGISRLGNRRKGTRMQPAKIAVIGVDLGKNSCSLAVLDGHGTVVERRRMRP